jgi:hypothetical protein
VSDLYFPKYKGNRRMERKKEGRMDGRKLTCNRRNE